MSSSRERARDLLPSVLLTLLSIVQAIALETFWDRFETSDHLWAVGWPAWIGWLQAATLLVGITEIWLFYVSVILRFSWVPGVRDMVLPFGIGLLEFTLVDLQGIDRVGPWLICLAAVFAMVSTESHLLFRNARRDSANRAFFESFAPATRADLARQFVPVVLIAVLGLTVAGTGDRGALALAGVVVALGIVLWQLVLTAHYWRVSITQAPD